MLAGALLAMCALSVWAVPCEAAPRTPVGVTVPNPVAPITNLGGVIGGLADGAAKDTAATVLDAVSSWVASGTVALLGSMATAIDSQTEPDLTAGWFGAHYATMVEIAFLLALPLVFASVITAIVRQDAAILARTVFVQLPVAAIGTGVAVTIVNLALAASDWLCSLVSAGTGHDAAGLFSGLAKAVEGGVPGTGFALVLVSILVALGAFFLTLEMIVRSAAIYVSMLFLPITLVGLVWPATSRWGKRLAETLAVLILSKFVVVAIIAMAVSAVAAGAGGTGLSSLLAGAALLLLAGAAPFTLLRMVPIVEAGMIGHLEGMGRQAIPSSPVTSSDVLGRIARAGGASGDPPTGAASSSSGDIGRVTMTRGLAPDGTQSVSAVAGADAGAAAGGATGGASGGAVAGGAAAGGAAAGGASVAGVGAAAAAGPVGVAAAGGVAGGRAVVHRLEGAAAVAGGPSEAGRDD